MLAPPIGPSGATLRLALVTTTSGTAQDGPPRNDDVVSLYRAREKLRDLGLAVSVGALERWTETGRLPVIAHVPRGKRKITLVSLDAARSVVEAPALKRQAEDDELERAYKEGLTPVEAAARAGLTLTDGGARKRLKQLGVPMRTASETRRLKLDLYRRKHHGLLTAAELADVVPCSVVTVLRHRRAAEDGLGAFHGSDRRIWLFPPPAADQLRARIQAGRERSAAAITAARAEGRARRHKTGVVKGCPCGCDRITYLPKCRERAPGWVLEHYWVSHHEVVPCDICGRSLDRLASRVNRDGCRNICPTCLPPLRAALATGMMMLRRDNIKPRGHPSKATRESWRVALHKLLLLGEEFEASVLKHWPKTGRRPPLAINLAIDALHRHGFTDEALNNFINDEVEAGRLTIPGVPGGKVNNQYVKRRRHEAKIRRRVAPPTI
jgi:hypothetical protein